MVLYAGQLAKRKGVEVFRVVIASVLREVPEAKFVFVGRDRPRERGETLMSQFILEGIPQDIGNRVTFLGERPWKELATYYQMASVCVLPSLFECFGLTCVESMATGCTVIGSKNGGMAEIINNGINGFLVDPTDAEAIVGRIVDCLKHQEPALCARARERAVSSFSFRAVGEKALEVYRNAIGVQADAQD
jgi:glycosyltransferase involved in cell wall biosynthesis